jgi:hypothetical protein
VTRQFCTDTTILLQKPAEPASAFSMAELVAVMTRRGEEEDEEGSSSSDIAA